MEVYMAFFEFFLKNDLWQDGKRLNKGSKIELTTPGNRKPTRSELRKAAQDQFPNFSRQIGCHDAFSLFDLFK